MCRGSRSAEVSVRPPQYATVGTLDTGYTRTMNVHCELNSQSGLAKCKLPEITLVTDPDYGVPLLLRALRMLSEWGKGPV